MQTNESSLPPFEFSSGYILGCIDMGNIGLKITLNHNGEDDRAIILPPEECGRFLDWQRLRIGEKISAQKETDFNTPMTMEKITSDVEMLYEIIENDIGVTVDEIRDFKGKQRPIVFARDVMCFILRLRFGLSTVKIAAVLGAQSHASVILACRKFNTEQIRENLYKQPDLLKIFKDAKRRYKPVIVFKRR